ncbi:MAG: peptide-methionine (R)-S-oxide reductase, partial [Gallionellaceae bacterium CG1_02_56_997]
MNRRGFIKKLLGCSLLLALPGIARQAFAATVPLIKSQSAWRKLLPAERYAVLFEQATEPSHSSPLNGEKRAGTFVCAACFLPLFSAKQKYESGTGWPSFWQALPDAVATRTDYKLIWPRTEYHCARCGGHQGHRFDDVPKPTGLRYCNNGLALEFIPEGTPLPALRT